MPRLNITSLVMCCKLYQNQYMQRVSGYRPLLYTDTHRTHNECMIFCLLSCQITVLFPLCRGWNISLLIMDVAPLARKHSEKRKGTVGVYVRQLQFVWRLKLICELLFPVSNFSVVMTCLNPLAHLPR